MATIISKMQIVQMQVKLKNIIFKYTDVISYLNRGLSGNLELPTRSRNGELFPPA